MSAVCCFCCDLLGLPAHVGRSAVFHLPVMSGSAGCSLIFVSVCRWSPVYPGWEKQQGSHGGCLTVPPVPAAATDRWLVPGLFGCPVPCRLVPSSYSQIRVLNCWLRMLKGKRDKGLILRHLYVVCASLFKEIKCYFQADDRVVYQKYLKEPTEWLLTVGKVTVLLECQSLSRGEWVNKFYSVYTVVYYTQWSSVNVNDTIHWIVGMQY